MTLMSRIYDKAPKRATVGAVPEDQKWIFEATLKSRQVEELINLHWHRRLAFLVVRGLRHFPSISPNHVTLLAGFFGFLSAYSVWEAAPLIQEGVSGTGLMFLSAFLLLASVVLDCSDGMLARLSGKSSPIGTLMDGFTDTFVVICLLSSLYHLFASAMASAWTLPIMLFVAISLVVHTGLYDHYKGLYISYIDPNVDSVAELKSALVQEDAGFVQKAFGALYSNVYGLIFALAGGHEEAESEKSVSPELVSEALAPAMRKVSYVGLGTHMAVLYFTLILSAFSPTFALYFLVFTVGVVLNIWTILALKDWKRRELQLSDYHYLDHRVQLPAE